MTCDRFTVPGAPPMMPMLGEPHLGYPDPIRASLLGLTPYGPAGYSVGIGPIVPVPLWRPLATHPSALLCNSAGCPCNMNRSPLMSDILDFYNKSAPPSDPWRPWHSKSGDSYYKAIDSRQSPGKELPTKLLKQDRTKERQDLSQTLQYDREHILKLKNRCDRSQPQHPQHNQVEPDVYRNGERHITSLDSYSLRRHYPLLPPPPPPPPSQMRDPRGSPPKYSSLESPDAPLNLSLSSSSSSAFSTQISRPSVITCAPTVAERAQHYSNISPPLASTVPAPHNLSSPTRREIISAGCEPDIEEHFRRSLGRDYMTSNSPKLVQPPPPPPPKVPSPPEPVISKHNTSSSKDKKDAPHSTNVSITGTVDDHFAKSLGTNMWSAIKAKSDPDQLTVDDHFAKALGDTWLRIKKEKETNGTVSPPSSPQQRRQDGSLVST